MKLKSLQTYGSFGCLRFFWNYLDIDYVFESKCNMWVLCGFNPMSCVISQWSPDYSLCDNRTRSKSVPFHFKWYVLPYYPWGEEVLWLYVGEAIAHGAKRPHAKEVLFYVFSLLPMGWETKPWGYRWGCCPWNQKTTYQRRQYHVSCKWVNPLTGLCDSVVYLW